MPGLHEYLLFTAAGLLLNITPGADMLYVMTNAARYGHGRGIVSALGVFTGTLVHIALAVVGLSAMLAASAWAFSVVKYLGAAYLAYLGLRLLFARPQARGPIGPALLPESTPGRFKVFRDGALINLLNPKITLFFVAFLPQFIVPGAPDQALAFAVLGLTFNITGTAVNCLAALSVVSLARLSFTHRIRSVMQRSVGALFVALGVRLAITGHAAD
ncbi:LysE family translocator [Salinisphaera sp. SPP-AMP-43]|uniref:LysE family translocator n=1 Tax=Salinisphaera sp. SPP-AMP-43 TaxID=3121288 RepID=UPI003C6E25D0